MTATHRNFLVREALLQLEFLAEGGKPDPAYLDQREDAAEVVRDALLELAASAKVNS